MSTIDRRVLALAVPALGALVAEPAFVLVDSAIVGHLGPAPLAGLALGSTVLTTVVGMCVFLAYATTAAVARRSGSGDADGALRSGIDGLWLAFVLGLGLGLLVWLGAPWLVGLGAHDEVARQGVTYLRWSAIGLPGMLAVLAATGVLRGLRDTRTPLLVAATGAVVNAGLNALLVYPVGLGIAGSGLGTAATQLAMAAWLGTLVVRGARRRGVAVTPTAGGLRGSLRAGAPLLVRTATLRAAIVLTTWVAAGLGTTVLAAHQVVNATWGLTAFALDALAIAALALVGHALGAGDVPAARALLGRTLRWGVGAGLALAILVAAGSPLLVRLFSADLQVRRTAVLGLLVAAACLPMAGWVFVLDGVLIGAGDGAFLARAGALTLLVYLPAVLAVRAWAPAGPAGLAWLWAAFAGLFLASRALTTGWRARGSGWTVTGSDRR